MSEERKTGKPGDTVELRDKETGFTDPQTGFDISRDQQVKLGDSVGDKTQQAVLSGGLLIVSSGKRKAKEESTEKTDDSDLPADLPGRDAFIAAGLNFDQVKALETDEELLAIKGIGAGTVKALKEWAAANKPKD